MVSCADLPVRWQAAGASSIIPKILRLEILRRILLQASK